LFFNFWTAGICKKAGVTRQLVEDAGRNQGPQRGAQQSFLRREGGSEDPLS